ncbi:MAG: adenylyltransferase/cytidyltransferase family protein [Lachnospiraceae bacterium]|nr:adenylyltransferase/cytidyltransferase family protein [Lachnospiraceae bacterium]
MIKVITYGTYDLLHYGHIKLLERAKALGDYLIVGVTADDFDKKRGKINVSQSLMERIEAVRATGIADEIIVEEYEGQKIDDIRKYGVDIFTVGSDWEGKFDYLNEYCKVVYLPRTEGVSSSEIRTAQAGVRLGLVGDSLFLNKVYNETAFVNGLKVYALCTNNSELTDGELKRTELITNSYDELLENVDAVYLRSLPSEHYEQIKKALDCGRHVLCESPVTVDEAQCEELYALAREKKLILMEAIKTAYSTAFARLLLLIKGGSIGNVISVDATCTSLKQYAGTIRTDWNGIYEWGPTALLPVLEILGTGYKNINMIAHFEDDEHLHDSFVKMDFLYDHAVASIKVGDGVKSEGELIISGTKGYIYVPAPWWKTDYFEVRYENPDDNRRHFYQLDGEGIRYELVAFVRAIERGSQISNIDEAVTFKMAEIMKEFENRENVTVI